MVENVTDRPPVHTKTAHFCQPTLKMEDLKNGTPSHTFLETATREHSKMVAFFDAFRTRLIDTQVVGTFLVLGKAVISLQGKAMVFQVCLRV